MTISNIKVDVPYTEGIAMQDVLEWSETRPNWQRDALRRIVVNGNLSETDLSELEVICIDHKAPFEPLMEDHLGSGVAAIDAVSLIEISNLKQVNALAENQTVTFKSQGISIVYGDNGSGKSGFARILKHACRSRDPNLKILRPISEAGDEPQSAEITFQRGMSSNSFNWTPEGDGHSDLSSVSIFDTKSANVHVEKTNELAYTPLPMQVFERLSSACIDLSSRIDARVSAYEAQTPLAISAPKVNPKTVAAKFILGLSEKSSIEDLDGLTTFSQNEQDELKSLQADLAQSPDKAVALLGAQSERLRKAMEALGWLHDCVADKNVTSLSELRSDLNSKTALSTAASDQLFSASPLPKIGETLWHDLWEAARQYSNVDVYPEKEFPEAESETDLCVLCQQPLSDEAIVRRDTFESFVKSTTRNAEIEAKRLLEIAENRLTEVKVSPSSVLGLRRLLADEIGDQAFAKEIQKVAILDLLRLRVMRRGDTPIIVQEKFPVEEVKLLLKSFEERISQVSAGSDSPERSAMLDRYAELNDRKTLADMKPDILAEIGRKSQARSLEEAKKSTAKRAITEKNKDISNKLITDALRGRFAREVTKLKIGSMPIELRKTDRRGQTYFRVCFVEKPDEPVGDVLSEGEHRCVALAAFLAELVTSAEYSGIVFDDPMSSLDHLNRRTVAKRLVEEAEYRQVIIFTHDLTFLFELKREAEVKGIEPHYQHVHRRMDKPGHVSDALPLKAKPGLELTNTLRSELKAIKHEFDDYSEARREIVAKGFLEKFREAWDQGIADFIIPVLGRFDNDIRGNGIRKLAVLSDEDVTTVTDARKRLSEEMHVNSEALNPAAISLAEMVEEVEKLEKWLHDIKQRQKDVA